MLCCSRLYKSDRVQWGQLSHSAGSSILLDTGKSCPSYQLFLHISSHCKTIVLSATKVEYLQKQDWSLLKQFKYLFHFWYLEARAILKQFIQLNTGLSHLILGYKWKFPIIISFFVLSLAFPGEFDPMDTCESFLELNIYEDGQHLLLSTHDISSNW